MPEILFKNVQYNLLKLLEDIEVGEIALPELQRPFVWKATKVRDLFDSMYRGYPIGHVLFWETGRDTDLSKARRDRPVGTDDKQKPPRLLIIDGQQRLTSLYAVIKRKEIIDNNYNRQTLRIAFNPVKDKFEVSNAAVEKDAEWIPDISVLWAPDTSLYAFIGDYIDRLSKTREVPNDLKNLIAARIDRLHKIAEYPIMALEISQQAGEEQVAEIFVRINSKGKPLNQADFILTLMSVFWDEGRAELEQFARAAKLPSPDGSPSPFNHYIQPSPDQLLRVAIALAFKRARLSHVYSILRGKDLKTGEFSERQREENFAKLRQAQKHVLNLTNWHEFLRCLQLAGFMSGSMITSEIALMFAYALWLIGKVDFGAPYERLRPLIARWFYMSMLTSRYSSSSESTFEQDLLRLRTASSMSDFEKILDDQIEAIFTHDYWTTTLPAQLDSSASRSPGQFTFFAAQCLLDAPALYSDLKVVDLLRPDTKGNRTSLERHHLFPKKYLKSIGISEDRLINQIANFALVEWHDNSSIADKPPHEYAPEFERRFAPETLTRMYDLHALESQWYASEYENFLEMRRKRMADIIRRGYEQLKSSSESARQNALPAA